MLREIVNNVFLGGFCTATFNVNMLAHAGVTHVINASNTPLSPIIRNQFWSMEIAGSDIDVVHEPVYWSKVFGFARNILRRPERKLYFHAGVQDRYKRECPLAAYAGLRSLGYSRDSSRQKLDDATPILTWQEHGILSIDEALEEWCTAHHIKIHCQRSVKPPKPFTIRSRHEEEIDEALNGHQHKEPIEQETEWSGY